MNTWFRKHAEDVLHEQNVESEKGLSTSDAEARLRRYGKNRLESGKKVNPLMLFLSQFKDVLIIILLVAAVVSWGIGLVGENDSSKGAQEALLIFVIVLAIALIGFFNEYKAEKTVEALKKLVGAKATVRRSGEVLEIDATDVVPGDIVILDEGQKVPADMRLVQVRSLQINEASLTGESLPSTKQEELIGDDASLGDQKNMAFAGTFVTQGTAVGVVVETGQTTELGRIASLVNDVEDEQTPMQKKLDDLGKKIGLMILLVCTVIFVVVIFLVDEARDKDTLQRMIFAFTAAVALAVAAIPEGLAFVVRISLALGARRMAAKNGLVRRLSAVEALGSTDVICSDKTGTLTKGEMTVREIVAGGLSLRVTGSGYSMSGEFLLGKDKAKRTKAHDQLLLIGSLCNNARLKDDIVLGDPTEGSLLVSAGKAGVRYDIVQQQHKRLDEIPFTSDRKFMSTVHDSKNGFLVAAKGSVEATLERCARILDPNGQIIKLTTADKQAILQQNKALSSQALRVLAFAQKESKTEPKGEKEVEKDLVFVGLQAMMDPPRAEVVQVVHRVQTEAGIRVVMITGDYIETAKAIAEEVGIKGEAISGVELEAMSQKEFEQRVEEISVYARVNPEHKIRIVKALKKHGHQVAMTGDGVNDAPAIKAADIGIAMGITGSDAAKEAADLILLDDKFVTIVNAIEEGRGIYDNMRKFVNFLISCNIAEVLVILFGIFFFNNLLLTVAQLLFINILTDGLPAVALGSDPARKDVLKAKPAQFQEAILNKRTWAEIFVFGALMTIIMLVQYSYNLDRVGTTAAVSAAFCGMVVYELVRLIDIRTDYKIRWFSNPLVTIGIVSSILAQIAILYIAPIASYFNVQPLQPHDWVFMAVGSALIIIIMKLSNPILDRFFGAENHPGTV